MRQPRTKERVWTCRCDPDKCLHGRQGRESQSFWKNLKKHQMQKRQTKSEVGSIRDHRNPLKGPAEPSDQSHVLKKAQQPLFFANYRGSNTSHRRSNAPHGRSQTDANPHLCPRSSKTARNDYGPSLSRIKSIDLITRGT